MTVVNRGRRQFLQGTGGFLLALPILPSLMPRSAKAQSAPAPRFIAFATEHGAVFNQSMWPSDSMLTEKFALYSDHNVQRGKLVLRSDGSRTALSEVLSAPASTLTSELASKLNVLRGFDIPFYIAHHGGGHLGNYAVNQGTAENVKADQRPTIDHVMAYSPSFYRDLSSIKERLLHVGSVDTDPRFNISWGYENPASRSGVSLSPPVFSAMELFNRVFVPPTEVGNTRKPVVDSVLASYNRLRSGAFGDANRLSKADKQRLDDHMDRLHELQRTLSVTASCGDAPAPSYDANNSTPLEGLPEDQSKWYQTFNDVIVAGMMCGTTRLATVHAVDTFDVTHSGDAWHQNTVHVAFQQPEAQAKLVSANRRFFETVFLDLAQKLDVEEGDTGKTYLDNSLIMWSQEAGMEVHECVSMPVITAGSAAGHFNTGNYVDFSNRDNRVITYQDTPGTRERRPGLLYTQWLANVLKSMGVPPSEWERAGEKGYGVPYRDDSYLGDATRAWPDRVFNDASNDLPFITG